MPVQHTCFDGCFDKRTAAKQTILCFLCGHKCNLRCHHITNEFVIKIISSNSNVIFLCTDCQTKPIRSKRMSNISSSLSAPVSPATSPAPSISETSNQTDNKTNKSSDHSTEIIALLGEINERLTKIENKDDAIAKTNSPREDTTTENIFKLVVKIDDKIDKLHSTENEKSNLQRIISAIDKNTSASSVPVNKSLNLRNIAHNNSLLENWSMQIDSLDDSTNVFAGRPSLMVKQTVDDDILEILKNSEQTTWDSIDLLSSEIKQQNTKLDMLLDRSHRPTTPINSPLVDSIISSNVPQNSSFSTPGNSTVIEKQKEAMTQTEDLNIVPETLKPTENMQKRLKPTLSDGGPEDGYTTNDTEHNTTNKFHTTASMADRTEFLSNTMLLSELSDSADNASADPSAQQTGSYSLAPDNIVQPNVNIANTTKTELYLTRFVNNTTVEMIENYLKSKVVFNVGDIKISRLIPKGKDPSTLSFVSFKVDVSSELAHIISNPALWPNGCKITNFIKKPPKVVEICPAAQNNDQDLHFLYQRPMENNST